MNSVRFASTVIFLTILVSFAGCDSDNKNWPASGDGVAKETHPKTVEEQVAERAEARWQARIAKDWKVVYGFMSPGYRSTHPYDVFAAQMSRAPLFYRKASVEKVVCQDAERCIVELNIESEYRGTQAQFQGQVSTSKVKEQWIRLGGQWWFGR